MKKSRGYALLLALSALAVVCVPGEYVTLADQAAE